VDLSYKEVTTKGGEAWKEPVVQFSCDESALDAYRSSSWVHNEIAEHAMKAVPTE